MNTATLQTFFDTEYTTNRAKFDALAADPVGPSSQNYYNFQFVLQGTISMYEATGDVTYLERAMAWAETMMSKATIVDGKGYKNWPGPWLGSPFIPTVGIIYTLCNLQGCVELACLCRVIMTNRPLYARYWQRAKVLFDFVRSNCVEKEVAFQGGWFGWIEAYTTKNYSDKAALLARILLNLYGCGFDENMSHTSMLTQLLSIWRGLLISRPDGSMIWDQNKYNNAGSPGIDHAPDIVHANRWAALVVDAVEMKMVLDMRHLTDLGNLFCGLWNQSLFTPQFTNFIDGANDVFDPQGQNRGPWQLAYIYPGWSMIGAYHGGTRDVCEAVLMANMAGHADNNNTWLGRTCLSGDLARNLTR